MKATKDKETRKSAIKKEMRRSQNDAESIAKRGTKRRRSSASEKKAATIIKVEESNSGNSSSSVDTLSSNLSEFMTSNSSEDDNVKEVEASKQKIAVAEKEEEEEEDDFSNNNIVEILSNAFPLKINEADIKLTKLLRDNTRNSKRELLLLGKYNGVEISCTSVIAYNDQEDERYHYAFQMSEELLSCRNVANYLGVFITTNLKGMMSTTLSRPILSEHEEKQSILCIIQPWFRHGTLAQYLKLKRSGETHIEPLYILQMAITLFAMLSDAHDQGIGIVDLNLYGLYVGDDEGLYFGRFENCLYLDDSFPTHKKPWMNIMENAEWCPESKDVLEKDGGTYKKSMDVFLASRLVLELIKDFEYRKKERVKRRKLYRQTKGKISVRKEAVDPRHANLIEIIEQGLNVDPKDRPTASDILYWLETIRHKSIAAAGI